ncbi:TPA: hypothetical protein DDZ86_01140 [Candidatus Dependentiae bacterium]|nr:MAG: hypothetical protein UW09_C0004G0108 [candidate division TM6 bacterium GW2011_GWF2_43_87]HBL98231.1 hypothetical protein [Candidatus Dependentiae bacterium]
MLSKHSRLYLGLGIILLVIPARGMNKIQNLQHPQQTQEPVSKQLFDAAKNGDLPLVTKLIDVDHANVNVSDNRKNTPLHYACLHECEGIVKKLIASKANPNAENIHYKTPLHFADLVDNLDIIKILILSGANPSGHPKQSTPALSNNNGAELISSIIPFKKEGPQLAFKIPIVSSLVFALLQNKPLPENAKKFRSLIPLLKMATDLFRGLKVHTQLVITPQVENQLEKLSLEKPGILLTQDTHYFYKNLERVFKCIEKEFKNETYKNLRFNDLKINFTND